MDNMLVRLSLAIRRVRIPIVLAGWGVYLGALLLLYFNFGFNTNALEILPVILSAWLLGWRAGLVIGLLSYPLNVLMFWLLGYPRLGAMLGLPMIPPMLGMIAIGGIVGWLRELRDRLQDQLIERKQAEEALRESEEKYHRLVDSAPLGIFQSTPEGKVISVNPAFVRMFGYDSLEDVMKNVKNVATDVFADPNRRSEIIRMTKENPDLRMFENVYRRKDGSTFTGRLHLSVIKDASGRLVRTEGIIEDITGRKRAENILQARLRLSEFSDSHSLDALLQKSLDEAEALTGSQIGFFHFLEADQKTLHFQTWSTNTLEKMCTAEGKGQHYDVDVAGVWVDCIHARQPVIHNDYASLPHRKGLPEGHAPVIRELVVPVLRGDLIVAIVGMGNKPADYDAKDVEAVSQLANLAWEIVLRKRAEESLRESEEKYRTVANFTYDWEAWRAPDMSYLYVSPSCKRITGYSAEKFLANPGLMLKIIHPDDRPQFMAHYRAATQDAREQDWHLDFRIVTANGEIRWISHYCIAVHTEDGRWLGHRESNRDITERKQVEIELQYMKYGLEEANTELQTAFVREQKLAQTDGLTGLKNRIHFFDLAAHEFGVAVRYQQPLTVIMFDIDHFKQVNDTFGHQMGDMILKAISHIASEQMRDADILARYGGEEFVALFPQTDAQQTAVVAERIRQAIGAYSRKTGSDSVSVTVSVGIAEILSQGDSLDYLVQRADQALYTAKTAGRNRVAIFTLPAPDTQKTKKSGAFLRTSIRRKK